MKEFKIECPEEHVIDLDNSDLDEGIIKFKNKHLIYEDVAKEMFYNKKVIGLLGMAVYLKLLQ